MEEEKPKPIKYLNLEHLGGWRGDGFWEIDLRDSKYLEVEEVSLRHCELREWHIKNLGYLPNLKSLSLMSAGNFLTKLNGLFGRFSDKRVDLYNLEELSLHNCEIPNKLGELTQLRKLTIFDPNSGKYHPKIPSINFPSLVELNIGNISVQQLPDKIVAPKLRKLSVSSIKDMDYLPEFIRENPSLKSLDIQYTNLKRLPSWISDLKNLEDLNLRCNCSLESILDEIGQLKKLRKLTFDHDYNSKEGSKVSLKTLPQGIGGLENLQYLFAYNVRYLKDLPESIFNLKNLKVYDFKDTSLNDFSRKILQKMTWAKPRQHKGAIFSMLEKNEGNIGLSGGYE